MSIVVRVYCQAKVQVQVKSSPKKKSKRDKDLDFAYCIFNPPPTILPPMPPPYFHLCQLVNSKVLLSSSYATLNLHLCHIKPPPMPHQTSTYATSNLHIKCSIFFVLQCRLHSSFVLKLVATSSCKSLINFCIFALTDTSIMLCTRRLFNTIVVNSPNVNVPSFHFLVLQVCLLNIHQH